jgi:flagellar basal body-associated protein FliL
MQDIDADTEDTPPKKSISDKLVVFLVCFIFAIILKGWKEFFVALGIMPLQTIAELMGASLVPFMSGWLVAKLLGLLFKTVSFKRLWLGTSFLFFVIMLIGQYRANDRDRNQDAGVNAELDKIEQLASTNTEETHPPSVNFTENSSQESERLPTLAEAPSKELVTPDAENQRWKFNYYALEKPLLSNVAGSRKVMQVTLTVMTHYDDRVIKNVKTHELALRKEILVVMRQKTEADLREPDFRKTLAEEIRLTINSLLEKYEGFGGIEEVMFTEFILQ